MAAKSKEQESKPEVEQVGTQGAVLVRREGVPDEQIAAIPAPNAPSPSVSWSGGEWQTVGIDDDGVVYERNTSTFARRAVGEPVPERAGVFVQQAWLDGGTVTISFAPVRAVTVR